LQEASASRAKLEPECRRLEITPSPKRPMAFKMISDKALQTSYRHMSRPSLPRNQDEQTQSVEDQRTITNEGKQSIQTQSVAQDNERKDQEENQVIDEKSQGIVQININTQSAQQQAHKAEALRKKLEEME